MRKEDIAQVTDIDREAFPTQWPAANYRREFRSRFAHYIVAGDEEERTEEPEVKASPQEGFSGWAFRVRQFFRNRFRGNSSSGRQNILGFAGFCLMSDEAHIASIAVGEKYRYRGIGELLLISLVDLAIELDARVITLEVRASNTAAQKLYSKYGFIQVGLRRGYYTDNREDGVLMSLENITSAPARANLQRLKQAHSQKWGTATYQVAR